MARTNAYSIFQDKSKITPDLLKEVYGGLIESIQKGALSVQLKNQRLSGNPAAGSVEVQRYINSASKAYGTARGNGEGDQIINQGKVTINLDTRREIVEELTINDVQQNTVDGLVASRTANHADTVIRELDYAFFTVAENAATPITPDATEVKGIIEEVIQTIEGTKNDYVDGVDRSLIALSLTPAFYGEIRTELDIIEGSRGESFVTYHGVRVYSNVRQTADVVGMVIGSVAQPVALFEYAPDRIPLSNDMALNLFFQYGTKAVTPDLIVKVEAQS